MIIQTSINGEQGEWNGENTKERQLKKRKTHEEKVANYKQVAKGCLKRG